MKKILFYIVSAISMLLIPITITIAIVLTLAVNENLYISIIKNLNPIETFIKTKNIQIEGDIQREVEKRTGISAFKEAHESFKMNYENKLAAYRNITKSDEFEKLDKQINELNRLKWEKSDDTFKTKDDFNKFKKLKMNDLKTAQKEIKDYRKENKQAINKTKNEMDDAENKFKDAQKQLKKKEKDAKKIIETRRGEFMNEIHYDIAKVEPLLSKDFNTLFVEKELKSVIKTYIDFLTSWKNQVKARNIYEAKLQVEDGLVENIKRIKLPPLKVSLRVKVKENGIEKEKNILSEVLVERIRETPGLKSPWVLTQIFRLSDSWIAAWAINSQLKDSGLRLSNGVIQSGQINVTGKQAENLEKGMKILSIARYVPYIAIGVILLFIILLCTLSSKIRDGLRTSLSIIKYSSIVMLIGSIAAIIVSIKPDLLFQPFVDDPIQSIFMSKILFITTLHIFIPIFVIFFALAFVTRIFLKIWKKKDD
ncbi:MAG: hypothetical protein FWG92_00550 [Leptospirales bacterium]|nr:hypothetical protein [Leptospirales bacterium]